MVASAALHRPLVPLHPVPRFTWTHLWCLAASCRTMCPSMPRVIHAGSQGMLKKEIILCSTTPSELLSLTTPSNLLSLTTPSKLHSLTTPSKLITYHTIYTCHLPHHLNLSLTTPSCARDMHPAWHGEKYSVLFWSHTGMNTSVVQWQAALQCDARVTS